MKGEGQGDAMTAFSSRGPGGQFLKPDITAPGAQILAGNTPIREDVSGGPAGEYFQAIAGTSMSSPHAAGSAILLKALHPDWSPGAIKSALMTTAITDVVKEDLVTPADPFDFGAGRVDLNNAGDAPIVFDESALQMFALGSNPITALDVNTAVDQRSDDARDGDRRRTATNVSGQDYNFDVTTEAPAGAHDQGGAEAGTHPRRREPHVRGDHHVERAEWAVLRRDHVRLAELLATGRPPAGRVLQRAG